MGRRILLTLLVLTGASRGQALPDKALPEGPVSSSQTRTTFILFGAEVLADGITTRVLYQRHYDEVDPVAKPFIHAGTPGQIGASLLGVGAVGGAWWVLHRAHHERVASQFLRTVTAAEACNVGRQFSILRTSKK